MSPFTVESSQSANEVKKRALINRGWYWQQLLEVARGDWKIGRQEWSALTAFGKARGWDKPIKKPKRKPSKVYPPKKQVELTEELAARLGGG